MTCLDIRRSFARIVFTVGAGVMFGAAVGGSTSTLAQPVSSLPLPAATPVASIKSIVVAGREVSNTETNQATVTRGAQTVRIVLPFFLYKGDIVETFSETNVTVLFFDDPVPGKDNEVMLYPKSKISIASSDSWWGRAWAKVKDAFTSRTRYSRLSARGTEYEVNADASPPVLTVIEGTVEVVEGRQEIGAVRRSPRPEWESVVAGTVQFVSANFVPPSTQTQFGRIEKVPAGQTTALTVTYNIHTDCSRTHRYEFQTSQEPWFSFMGEKNFLVPGPRGTARETREIRIDATRLMPATYDAHVYAVCLDCQNEVGCSQNQLEWVYRFIVESSGPIPTASASPSPTPSPTIGPAAAAQTFRVGERQQSTISEQTDQVVSAPDSDVRLVLNWTGAVLMTTQPTYSAQNLIPHFTNISERNASFVAARERTVFSKDAKAFTDLANVYSDWGQPAWGSFAYEKGIDRARSPQATSATIDLAEAYRLSGRLTEAELKSASFANDTSVRARNFFGNIALDRARIALDAGSTQEVEARTNDAKQQYAAALAFAAAQTLPGIGQVNSAVLANAAEANIVAGEAALQNGQDAKSKFSEAVRSLESIQQASSIYPFPVTNLGVAYRGQGDAAKLSGDLRAATDAYANAKRQHEQAIAAHPDFAEAYFNLGDLYDDLGDREKAKANYHLAIQSRPEQPAAYYPLAMLLKDEDPALAAALAATFLKLERDAFLHGRKAENARKLADRRPVDREKRIGEQTGVPNLIGQTQSDALNAISGAGYRVGRIDTRPATGPAGVVLDQNPVARSAAAPQSVINLVVSTAIAGTEVTLRNFVGTPVAQARAELSGLGLVVTEKSKTDTKQPKEYVIEQSPKGPKQVKSGSKVELTVSAGDLVEIPDVKGKDLDDARKKITSDNKLKVGNVEYRPDCKVNEVLEQNPLPTKQKSVDRGTSVNLVVGALGDNPVRIPTFTDQDTVEQFVRENGLRLKRIRTEESERREGSVLKQSPKSGKIFGRNCPVDVDITVAIPIIWVDIEDYVNQPIDLVQQKLSGLEVHSLMQYQQSDAAPGTVLQQSPAGPARVKHWSYINFVVAMPVKVQTVTVPNLCGMKLEDARKLLSSPQYGLVNTQQNVSYDSPPNQIPCNDGLQNGQVMFQDPPANATVPRGSVVKLWIVNIIGRLNERRATDGLQIANGSGPPRIDEIVTNDPAAAVCEGDELFTRRECFEVGLTVRPFRKRIFGQSPIAQVGRAP